VRNFFEEIILLTLDDMPTNNKPNNTPVVPNIAEKNVVQLLFINSMLFYRLEEK
jgi:hypothetical protein